MHSDIDGMSRVDQAKELYYNPFDSLGSVEHNLMAKKWTG